MCVCVCVLYSEHAVSIFILFASLMCLNVERERESESTLESIQAYDTANTIFIPHINAHGHQQSKVLLAYDKITKSQNPNNSEILTFNYVYSIAINTYSIFEFLSIESACDSGRREEENQMGKNTECGTRNEIDKSMTAITQDDDEALPRDKRIQNALIFIYVLCFMLEHCCSFEVASTFAPHTSYAFVFFFTIFGIQSEESGH